MLFIYLLFFMSSNVTYSSIFLTQKNLQISRETNDNNLINNIYAIYIPQSLRFIKFFNNYNMLS